MIRKKIVHFTGSDQRKQANAAFLIGCYMVSVYLLSSCVSENAYNSGASRLLLEVRNYFF